MKKFVSFLVCVFLLLVFISVSVFGANYDFEMTVDRLKSTFDFIVSVPVDIIKFVTNYGKIELTDAESAMQSKGSYFAAVYNSYLPYYLDSEGLYDKFSNQSYFTMDTVLYKYHDHKIAKFTSNLIWDSDLFGYEVTDQRFSLDIYYCAVCDLVCCINQISTAPDGGRETDSFADKYSLIISNIYEDSSCKGIYKYSIAVDWVVHISHFVNYYDAKDFYQLAN